MQQKGIWLWPNDVEQEGASALFSKCADFGITDVFLLVKGLSGKVCYQRTALEIPKAFGQRDILAESLDAAHLRGIRVHAWFTSSNDHAYKEAHPEAGNAHFVEGRNNDVIRMSDSGYRQYMEAIVRELPAAYEIDGIHLDYIRFNHLSNGWGEEDRRALATRGLNLTHLDDLVRRTFFAEVPEPECAFDAYRQGDPDAHGLAAYRRETVVSFATLLLSAARSANPRLIATAALMPEGAYPDIAFSELHYGQNYQDAAGLYDYVVPMSYRLAFHEGAAWVKRVTEGAAERGNRVLSGIQSYDEATAGLVAEDIRAVETLKGEAYLGTCLFRYGQVPLAEITEALRR